MFGEKIGARRGSSPSIIGPNSCRSARRSETLAPAGCACAAPVPIDRKPRQHGKKFSIAPRCLLLMTPTKASSFAGCEEAAGVSDNIARPTLPAGASNPPTFNA